MDSRYALSFMSECFLLLGQQSILCPDILEDRVEGEGHVKARCKIIEFWSWINVLKPILFTDETLSPREKVAIKHLG